MEGDGIERLQTGSQRLLAVQIPEVAGICKAGTQHAFITGDNKCAIICGYNVGHKSKARRGRAIAVAQGKVTLVHTHGNLHHFGRQFHKLRINLAKERHRPFHQPGHFVHQSGIWHNLQPFGGCQCVQAFCNGFAAFCSIHHHMAIMQGFPPFRSAGNSHSTGVEEAMAFRKVGCHQIVPVIFTLREGERHGFTIQNAQNAAQRAHPCKAAASTPAHGFGPREAPQQIRQHSRNMGLCAYGWFFTLQNPEAVL